MLPLSRPDALRELELYGITGPLVYLIDVLPLIEMMWADGIVQSVERDLVEKFMRDHVANLNALAGYTVVDEATAMAFLDKFLRERPDPNAMATLTRLITPVRFSSSDAQRNSAQRRALLRWCLDIGASCVIDYPYGDHDRFSSNEKACFEEIFDALSG